MRTSRMHVFIQNKNINVLLTDPAELNTCIEAAQRVLLTREPEFIRYSIFGHNFLALVGTIPGLKKIIEIYEVYRPRLMDKDEIKRFEDKAKDFLKFKYTHPQNKKRS